MSIISVSDVMMAGNRGQQQSSQRGIVATVGDVTVVLGLGTGVLVRLVCPLPLLLLLPPPLKKACSEV